ncbi:MAG: DUF6455 family protein [Roseovarius sp.]|nr:DUF6455 family protein [Roseovarius sp.]
MTETLYDDTRMQGLLATLAEHLGIDLKRALQDPDLMQLVKEMNVDCAHCNNGVACAGALKTVENPQNPPVFCPNRHRLGLLIEKSSFGEPLSYDDPFAHGRSHTRPVTTW